MREYRGKIQFGLAVLFSVAVLGTLAVSFIPAIDSYTYSLLGVAATSYGLLVLHGVATRRGKGSD